MNSLQVAILMEWIIGVSFAIFVFIFRENIFSSLYGFLLFTFLSLILILTFHIVKKNYGFVYSVGANPFERIFNEYVFVRYFLFIYFLIVMLSMVLIISSGGFESESSSWLLLILPLFLPFYFVIMMEQLKLAKENS